MKIIKKTHIWFGKFTNIITYKVRNKIKDPGSNDGPIVVKGLKNE